MQKIGRNDPCWCGSGKKYKDCHMELEEKLTQFRRHRPHQSLIKNTRTDPWHKRECPDQCSRS